MSSQKKRKAKRVVKPNAAEKRHVFMLMSPTEEGEVKGAYANADAPSVKRVRNAYSMATKMDKGRDYPDNQVQLTVALLEWTRSDNAIEEDRENEILDMFDGAVLKTVKTAIPFSELGYWTSFGDCAPPRDFPGMLVELKLVPSWC